MLPREIIDEAVGHAKLPIYEDNAKAVAIFAEDLATQWRCSMSGPVGLDYNVMPFIFDVHGITDKEEQADLYWCWKRMERAALAAIHRK